MKRMPSFSSRPGFPLGLRVLVVDESAEEAESMLKACGFNPVSCRSSREALRIISTGTHQVDVLLVDAGCLARKSPESTALLSWARTLPLVLMAKGQAEMVSGITKQGAVEVMEKPLHQAKLKNIWQHVVRKMLSTKSEATSKGGHSNGTEVLSGNGSGGSTHDMQVDEMELELDLETSSLLDMSDLGLSNSLSGLAQGFSHLLSGEQSSQQTNTSSYSAFPSRMRGRSSVELRGVHRPAPLHKGSYHRPSSAPPEDPPLEGRPKPVLGHSCGQLGLLTSSDMAWGLPTTPLRIAPKPGLLPPWMMPPAPIMIPPLSTASGMFGPTSGPGVTMSTILPNSTFKRADSAPLGSSREAMPPSMVHSLSFVMSCGISAEMGLAATPSSSQDSSSLKLDMEQEGVLPIGLRLRKSASFMDLINSQLVGLR